MAIRVCRLVSRTRACNSDIQIKAVWIYGFYCSIVPSRVLFSMKIALSCCIALATVAVSSALDEVASRCLTSAVEDHAAEGNNTIASDGKSISLR